MKTEKIIGYINYRKDEHIFILENYVLNLIPSTSEKLVEYSVTLVFDPITKRKSNGFLEDLILEGIKMDGKRIKICIQDIPSYKNGIFSYNVKWFYIYNQNVDDVKIKGINFVSPEINYIYSTKRYVKDDFDLRDGSFNNYNLEIQRLDRQLLGEFKYNNKRIKIYGSMSWKRKYNDFSIFEMWSRLVLEFNEEIDDLNCLYNIVILQKCVIDFLTYRNNNSFDTIETYSVSQNNEQYITGKFYVDFEKDIESDPKKIKHLIVADNIKKFGNIYELINSNIIYLSHICDSFDKRKIYEPQRMLSILIAFERFFNFKFDDKEIRDDKYLIMLEKVIEHLKNEKDIILDGLKASGKYNKFVKRISKVEVNYASRLRYVINKYPICISYINNIYNLKSNDKLINTITERIAKLRNDMAHGNTNINFTSENTKDLKFMEVLFYIIILSELEVEDKEIINKINWLFDIKLFMK